MARDPENPELTDDDFARARLFCDQFPSQYRALKRAGRPRMASPKIHIGFRLARDVVEGIRASGRGYNGRVERVLRDALARREL